MLNSVTLSIGQAQATQRCGGQAPTEARTQGRRLQFSQPCEHQPCAKGDDRGAGSDEAQNSLRGSCLLPNAARAQPRGVGRGPKRTGVEVQILVAKARARGWASQKQSVGRGGTRFMWSKLTHTVCQAYFSRLKAQQ